MSPAHLTLLAGCEVHTFGFFTLSEEEVVLRELHCFQGGVAQLHHGRLVGFPIRVEEGVLGQSWSSDTTRSHRAQQRTLAEVATVHLKMHFHPQGL